jgi:hypothetical protein
MLQLKVGLYRNEERYIPRKGETKIERTNRAVKK